MTQVSTASKVEGHSPDGVQHSGHSWHRAAQSKARSSKLAMAVQTTHIVLHKHINTMSFKKSQRNHCCFITCMIDSDDNSSRFHSACARVLKRSTKHCDARRRKRNIADRAGCWLAPSEPVSNCWIIYVLRSLAFNEPLKVLLFGRVVLISINYHVILTKDCIGLAISKVAKVHLAELIESLQLMHSRHVWTSRPYASPRFNSIDCKLLLKQL